MTAAVDVIVDRDDDIATVQAIHRLAAEQPTGLAIGVEPGTQDPRGHMGDPPGARQAQ